MKVKLTSVYRDEVDGGLRTPSVIGDCYELPATGKPFIMTSAPLSGGSMRYIETSYITTVDVLDHILTITTENNSVYTVEVLSE